MLVQKLSWIVLLLFLCQLDAKPRRAVTCEGNPMYISCFWGSIRITHANYGRTDNTTCASPGLVFSNTSCLQNTSLCKMAVRCDGRKSCSVTATNSVFTDPCRGTYKYLNVSYECQE